MGPFPGISLEQIIIPQGCRTRHTHHWVLVLPTLSRNRESAGYGKMGRGELVL